MIKIYRATTRLAFPIVVDGKKSYAMFSDDKNSFCCSDEKIQEYIEKSPHFERKEITLFKKIGEEKKVQAETVDPAPEGATGTATVVGGEFTSGSENNGEVINNDMIACPDVTDINGAVALLKGEPYKVHHMKLQNPAAILEQAKLNNISFPNWNPQ